MTTPILDFASLCDWLWAAACAIRGPVDAPKFKDYILPLIFLKRLSDVFDDEIARLAQKLGDIDTAVDLADHDPKLVRFYLPEGARWADVQNLKTSVGQALTTMLRGIAKANPPLRGVIDTKDFNARISGQRVIDDDRLLALIKVLRKHRLGLDDVEPDLIGRAYEVLLRRFAEGQGQSGGEFFTPTEVGWLIVRLLRPRGGETIHDPACGSGGLLIKARLFLERGTQDATPVELFGQEINPDTFAIAKMNMTVHDMSGEIAIGDSLLNPKFAKGGHLNLFDLVAANPMWNQPGYTSDFYKNDSYARFAFGVPPDSMADWGWVQHMYASLAEGGRAVVVLDFGSVSRGSSVMMTSRERNIRQRFVDEDLIEGVILLPENLFFNAGGSGVLVCLNRKKADETHERIVLINASEEFEKRTPKNYIPEHSIEKIAKAFHAAQDVPGFARVISLDDAISADYDLSPRRFVTPTASQDAIPLDEIVGAVQVGEDERLMAHQELEQLLKSLGFGFG